MMVITMRAAVGLSKLDPVTLDIVDRTDVSAVGADNFHMFFNLADICHSVSPGNVEMG
jgi:hypothetical protein